MAEQKQHAPTDKKLRKAREEGKFGKSRLLTQSLVFSLSLLIFMLIAPLFYERTETLLERCWQGAGVEQTLSGGLAAEELAFNIPRVSSAPDAVGVLVCLESGVELTLYLTLLCLLAVVLLALIIEFAQLGFKVTLVPLKFDPAKLDPAAGVKRIAGGVKDAWRVVLQFAVLAGVFIWFFLSLFERFAWWFNLPGPDNLQTLTSWLMRLTASGTAVLLLLGFAELFLERRKLYAELSMSSQELKDEYKQDEGDPLIKSQRRHEHQSLSFEQLASKVRASKVIIVSRRPASQ